MATPVPIAIPTEPIGTIRRPLDLIERVAKGDSEDPNLAPLYEDAIRDTIELFEAIGLRSLRTAKEEVSKFLHVLRAWASEHGPGWFHNSVSRTVIRAACRGSHAALSVTGGTQTVTWMSRCATRTCRSTPILRPWKKCATVRSNPAGIGAGLRRTVNF